MLRHLIINSVAKGWGHRGNRIGHFQWSFLQCASLFYQQTEMNTVLELLLYNVFYQLPPQIIFCLTLARMEIRINSSENNSIGYPLEFCKTTGWDRLQNNSYVFFEINISDNKSRRFDLSEVISKCIKVL